MFTLQQTCHLLYGPVIGQTAIQADKNKNKKGQVQKNFAFFRKQKNQKPIKSLATEGFKMV